MATEQLLIHGGQGAGAGGASLTRTLAPVIAGAKKKKIHTTSLSSLLILTDCPGEVPTVSDYWAADLL